MTAIKPQIVILSIVIMFLIACSGANAAPLIISWSNDITNDADVYPVPNYEQTVTFTAVPDETIITWSWYQDSTPLIHNYNNFSTSFSSPHHHNISVTGTNTNGTTQMITWYPIVHRELATEHVELLNESGYYYLLTSFEDDTDFEIFLESAFIPYTVVLGKLFFLLIFGAYFGLLWVRQEKSVIPIVLGFSIGGLLLSFISEDFAQMAVLFLIVGAMGVLYSIYRER